MSKRANKVRMRWLPPYPEVRQLLGILRGRSQENVRSMLKSIWDQTGTPQNPVEWSDPDIWITERLSGEEREIAKLIWEESQNTVNPRYVHHPYAFINNHELLVPDGEDIYQLTERGKAFLGNDDKTKRELVR